ncbi:hypothetical protein P3T76_010432 [Phytophthora citrophthora]|uniref:RxLR effector protein n=1 Tax=Phytophthora citrophthora TaxID=4793 RepID=A0AAD9LHE5_9STRA|nr:hypothetical protein P3T76_010432 [Phytophthora citrophthora]
MKFSAVLVLAAFAVAGAASESTNMLTLDPNTLTRVDPDMIRGPGPAVPAGDNPNVKKEMDELAGSNNGNYHTIDPHSLPTMDPKYLERLGPMTPTGNNPKLRKPVDEWATTSGTPDATKTAPPTLWRID